jgi:hypothetical protein
MTNLLDCMTRCRGIDALGPNGILPGFGDASLRLSRTDVLILDLPISALPASTIFSERSMRMTKLRLRTRIRRT